MTALEIIQRLCQRQGLPVPQSVVSSPNSDVIRMLALLNEGGEELRNRHEWTALVVTKSFTTIANVNQGPVTTVFGPDYDYMVYQTFWDGTRRLPLVGPLSYTEHRAMVNMIAAGVFYQYLLQQNNVIIQPVPPAGLSWNLNYYSLNWVQENTPGPATLKDFVTKDDDTFLISDRLILSDLRWRYKKEIGLPYAEEQRAFEELLDGTISTDGGRRPIIIDDNDPGLKPGIFVPDGNWTR